MTSPAPRYRIGIDLGGTKIEAIALAPDGREILRQRVPTPKDDYRGTVTAIAARVAKLEGESGERATVGVGMPGAISPATGLVKNANSTWLNGQPFRPPRSCCSGRARTAAGERRQLPRRLGGDRWRRRRCGPGVRRHHRHGRGRRHRPPRRSMARRQCHCRRVGDRSRSRRRATTSGRGRPAIPAGSPVSRRCGQARACCGKTMRPRRRRPSM